MQELGASDARRIALARLNTDAALEDIYRHILERAKTGLFELSYKAEFDLSAVVTELIAKGYEVDCEYDEGARTICVIHVSWENLV